MLNEIKVGQAVTLRVLHEFRINPSVFDYSLLSTKTINRYFEYYFFNRKDIMCYPIASTSNTQADNLLEMLSNNERAVSIYKNTNLLTQSFSPAGKLFKAIDSPTQGLIVP